MHTLKLFEIPQLRTQPRMEILDEYLSKNKTSSKQTKYERPSFEHKNSAFTSQDFIKYGQNLGELFAQVSPKMFTRKRIHLPRDKQPPRIASKLTVKSMKPQYSAKLPKIQSCRNLGRVGSTSYFQEFINKLH